MKEHKHLYRPFPYEETSIRQHDHLRANFLCTCILCGDSSYKPNPQINIDDKYEKLKSQVSKDLSVNQHQHKIESYSWYLKKLANISRTLPHFQMLDIMVLQKGDLLFYISYEDNKCKIHFNAFDPFECRQHYYINTSFSQTLIMKTLLQRKQQNDLSYKMRQYKKQNPKFQFAQLDHESQKLIKAFDNKIKFIDQMLNRVVIIKQKPKIDLQQRSVQLKKLQSLKHYVVATPQLQQQKILTKYQFCNLFNKTRVKVCQLSDIQYIQLFPVMYDEQQSSYTQSIKYFRQNEYTKKLFKQAENYVLAWFDKNQTLQNLQIEFIRSYFYKQQNFLQQTNSQTKRLKPQVQQQFLMYQTYKLMIHFQTQTNLRIDQCLVEFMTINSGEDFLLKAIKYIKYWTKKLITVKQDKLPNYKKIDQQDYINDIGADMKKAFQKLQTQFHKLNGDWENFQQKRIDDKNQSNHIFKAALNYQSNKQINLHEILKSKNKNYKQKMLKLNQVKK